MFEGVKGGAAAIGDAIKAFWRHPALLGPLLCCWMVYAPIVLYFEFYFPWDSYDFKGQLLVVFAVILTFSFVLTCSCLVLLEMLQQIGSGRRASFGAAVIETVTKDLVRALPIMLIWAVIWFVLSVLEALLSRKRDREDRELSAQNAARTLSGSGGFSLSAAFFRALRKGVRMVVFLILPAIAWEDKSPVRAVRRGFGILKSHMSVFGMGFLLSEMVAFIVFLPPAVLFFVSDEMGMTFSDTVWFCTILYSGFAWSFMLFIEQMFTAELYLWHLAWEKSCAEALAKREPLPPIFAVPRPNVLAEDEYLQAPD